MPTESDIAFCAQLITSGLRVNLGYADMLVSDIPEATFAHMPHPMMNHPAFCIGHLSLYPDEVLRMLGMDSEVESNEQFAALFAQGVECVEQDGRYPSKQALIAEFRARHDVVLKALPRVEPATFDSPNTHFFTDRLPTLGTLINFMLNNHVMMHLGQISAWRRAVGLGSVM